MKGKDISAQLYAFAYLFNQVAIYTSCLLIKFRFEYSDPKFDDMVQILESIFSGSTVQSIDNFLPFIDLIPVLRKKVSTFHPCEIYGSYFIV